MLDDATAIHLANRLGFGPAPGELERIRQQGFDGYVEEQLSPRRDLPAALTSVLRGLPSFGKDTLQLYRQFWWRAVIPGDAKDMPKDERKLYKKMSSEIADQVRVARLARSIASPWQLQEALTEFWFNHFNVYEKKNLIRIWVGAYEDEAIRPHTLGKFSDLLLATAMHPAMLVYLDNDKNVAPLDAAGGRPGEATPKASGINENYAREVMELHTLGVDGGYSQSDVTALAHILTGWSIGVERQAKARGGFMFYVTRHDPSPQMLLGRRFSGSSEEEGVSALLMLARHPSTARHISFKLAQYFVADKPPVKLVSDMAEEFQKTDGDLRAVMKVMLASSTFRDSENFGHKLKTPYGYVVSAARATGYDIRNVAPLTNSLKQLGQPLYGCVTPDGYACTETAWLDPDAMMRRISFAVSFGSGNFAAPSVSIDGEKLLETIGPELSPRTRAALAKTDKSHWVGAILGSPEFMRC